MPTIANSNAATQAEILAIAETSTAFATAAQGALADSALQAADIGSSVQAYDADTAKLDVAQVWTAQQNFQAVAITSSAGSIAWNLATAQVASHTATENTTLAAPSNIVAGGTYILLWTQHASAPKTLAFNAAYKFPGGVDPTVTATNGALDVFTFIGSADGTALLGVAQKAFA